MKQLAGKLFAATAAWLMAMLPSVATMAQDASFDQEAAYNRMYEVLTISNDPQGEVWGQQSLDVVRNLFELSDLTADVAYCVWLDAGVPELNEGKPTANNPIVGDAWTILFYAIGRCNYFLENATGTDATTLRQRAEARFLRALLYSYAIDLWGDVPLYTSTDETTVTTRSTRREVFDFVEQELKICQNDLPKPSEASYGRPSSAAATLLQARLLLNAEVYAGTPRWADAKELAQSVIDQGDFALCPNYMRLFMGDNGQTDAASEMLLALDIDSDNADNWGNTTYLIAASYDGQMPKNGLTGSWSGLVVRQALENQFCPNGIPVGKVADFQQAADDARCLLYGDMGAAAAPFADFYSGNHLVKFTNMRSKLDETTITDHADTDFPLLRLAEAYLIIAEADARLNGGQCTADGLEKLNTLRKRANATELATADLSVLADEWNREFYMEGRRRSDLVRFGLYASTAYTWDGKGRDVQSLMPIPTSVLHWHPDFTQNEGYEEHVFMPEDAYYYIGGLTNWDWNNTSMPFTRISSSQFYIDLSLQAGQEEWFKVFPASALSAPSFWDADLVTAQSDGESLGTGFLLVTGNEGAWHIPAQAADQDYYMLLDFGRMTFTLAEGTYSGIAQPSANAQAQGRIYDLQGRQCNGQPASGVYVRDGRKYVVGRK